MPHARNDKGFFLPSMLVLLVCTCAVVCCAIAHPELQESFTIPAVYSRQGESGERASQPVSPSSPWRNQLEKFAQGKQDMKEV